MLAGPLQGKLFRQGSLGDCLGLHAPEGGLNLQLSYRTISKNKRFPGLGQVSLQVMFLVELGLVMDTRIT